MPQTTVLFVRFVKKKNRKLESLKITASIHAFFKISKNFSDYVRENLVREKVVRYKYLSMFD